MKFLLKLFLCASLTNAISVSDLYPFGTHYGDKVLANHDQEDISSQEIKLNTSVQYFSRSYSAIFVSQTYFLKFITNFVFQKVNENGMLSFLTEIPSYFNIEFPLDYPIIAVYYSDVDCRASGQILYRCTSDPILLRRAQTDIKSAFQTNFLPTELFIATWDQVGYFEEKSSKVVYL